MDLQKHLLYLTKKEMMNVSFHKLRGIRAVWNDPTARLTFYFDGEVTEDETEKASDLCTYIISHFPNGLLEEHYERWDLPKPLPTENFVSYDL